MLNYSGGGIETTFTQDEDAYLAALVPSLPRPTERSLLVVGTLAEVVEVARFLASELGMALTEGGTPYLHRQHMAEELALLQAGTTLSEGQDVERQFDRCRAAQPDIAVCGLGPANPLEAEGITTKWSIELLFTPIQATTKPPTSPNSSPARCCGGTGCWRSAVQLTLWTYEGPPHVGAMRIAAAMQGVHLVLHAPQGDTYADLLFTMIERRKTRPPVTYTTFQARDLGGDTAELFKTSARDAVARFQPEALLVGASCTAELIQDDPGGLARALGLSIPVVALELPAYQQKGTGARRRLSISSSAHSPGRT